MALEMDIDMFVTASEITPSPGTVDMLPANSDSRTWVVPR
jgi:hypothetical protein